MRRCFIMRGLPGAGKNHWIAQQEWYKEDPIICSADDYFMVKGEYKFDQLKIGLAHRFCLDTFERHTRYTDSMAVDLIVVNNTNITAAEIAPYWALADMRGYEVLIVEIVARIDDCIQRNVHGVPSRVISTMQEAMVQEKLPPWWQTTQVIT